jgi:hypothetical protein
METRNDELAHHGVPGQKWGQRLYQNPDGSLTALGRIRYLKRDGSLTKAGEKRRKELEATNKSIKKKYNEDNKVNNNIYKQLTGKTLNRRGGGKNIREELSEKDIKDMSDRELEKYKNRLISERDTLQTKQQTRFLREKEAKEAKYDKMSKGQKFIKKVIDEHLMPSVKKGVKEGITQGVKDSVSHLITKIGNKEIDKFVDKQYENENLNNSKNSKAKSDAKKQYKDELIKDVNKGIKEFSNDTKPLIANIKKYVTNYGLSVHIDYAKKTNGRSFTNDFLKDRGTLTEAEIIDEQINDISKRQEKANKQSFKWGKRK